jgi:prevent-host-death family protein
MQKTLNATDAARSFSEILNSVKYKGDRYTIVRGGKPAAAIVPIEDVESPCRLEELRRLFRDLPGLGGDNEIFARDIEELISLQPAMPKIAAWE